MPEQHRRIELVAPDPRICPIYSGMRWYYQETPGYNRPIFAALKQCPRSMYHLNYIDLPAPRPAPAFTEQPS